MEKSSVQEVNQQVSSEHFSWLGGIIDGEGSISITKKGKGNSFTPSISICNTDWVIINQARKVLDSMEQAYFIQKHKGNKNWRERIEITISGFKRVSHFLPMIIPYLYGKKEKAEILMKYVLHRLSLPKKSSITSHDILVFEKMKELNGRGTLKTSTTIRETAVCG